MIRVNHCSDRGNVEHFTYCCHKFWSIIYIIFLHLCDVHAEWKEMFHFYSPLFVFIFWWRNCNSDRRQGERHHWVDSDLVVRTRYISHLTPLGYFTEFFALSWVVATARIEQKYRLIGCLIYPTRNLWLNLYEYTLRTPWKSSLLVFAITLSKISRF